MQFTLPDVVITTDAMPNLWVFYVQGFPCPLVAPGVALCTRCILPYANSRLLNSCHVNGLSVIQ